MARIPLKTRQWEQMIRAFEEQTALYVDPRVQFDKVFPLSETYPLSIDGNELHRRQKRRKVR